MIEVAPDRVVLLWAYRARVPVPQRIGGIRVIVRENAFEPHKWWAEPDPMISVAVHYQTSRGQFTGLYGMGDCGYWFWHTEGDPPTLFTAAVDTYDIPALGLLLPSIQLMRPGRVEVNEKDAVALRLAAEGH